MAAATLTLVALPEDAQRTYLQKAGRLSLKATKQGVDPARAARVQSAVHVRSASMAPWLAEALLAALQRLFPKKDQARAAPRTISCVAPEGAPLLSIHSAPAAFGPGRTGCASLSSLRGAPSILPPRTPTRRPG